MKLKSVGILFSIILLYSCNKSNGELTGNIVFKSDYYNNIRPDFGSRIYIFYANDTISEELKILKKEISSYKAEKVKYNQLFFISDFTDEHIQFEKEFGNLTSNINNRIRKLISDKNTILVFADMNGNFTIKIPRGKYYVLLVSNNVNYRHIPELNGLIDLKTITIKPGKRKNIEVFFENKL